MIYFSLVLFTVSIFNFSKKISLFSPMNFFCLFNVVIIFFYLFMLSNNDFPYSYKFNFSFPLYELGNNYLITSFVYFFFSILCFLFSLIKKNAYFSKLDNSNPQLELNKNLINFFSTILILLCIVHAFDLNWKIYWSYDYYLQVNQLDYNELDLAISKVFSSSKRLIGIISIFFFFTIKKKSIFKYFYLIVFFYIAFLTLIELSRFLPLLFLSIIISEYILNKKINLLRLIIFITLTISSYVFVMVLRGENLFGISEIFSQLHFILNNENQIISRAFANLFQGAIIFDISLNVNTYYPQIHKYLSLFPTLTIIDGWNVEWTLNNMINKNTPINSFAEAYHFGIGYLLFYQILIVIMLYISSLDINHKFYNRSSVLSRGKILFKSKIMPGFFKCFLILSTP